MNRHIFTKELFDSLQKHLDNCKQKYVAYPKFVFLCGKTFNSENEFDQSNRGVIKKFINSQTDCFTVVLSEKLWEDGFSSNIDLLTFEEFLAEISDFIILFPESPGSFCELGAFSYATERFSKKLIIVNDETHRQSKSFIETGPIAKAKINGAKIIYANLNRGLLSSKELRDTVKEIIKEISNPLSSKNQKIINRIESEVSISSFIYEILELIKLLQPINSKDLIDVYKTLKGFSSFSFIKDGENKNRFDLNIDYIYRLLQFSNIIKINSNKMLSLVCSNKVKNLMLNYQGQTADKERNKFLCRKYKFGGLI